MPQLLRSTILNTHKNGLKIIGTLMIISFGLVFIKEDEFYFSNGNLRLIFWFSAIYINYILLNKIDRKISASIMIAACYLSFFVYPLLPIETNHEENLFLLPSTLIVFSALPYLVFDVESEKAWIGGWLIVLIGTFLLAINYSIERVDKDTYDGLIIVFTDYTMLQVAFFASWLFIQIMFYRYLQRIQQQKERISAVNNNLDEKLQVIDKQNTVLDRQSNELMKLQEEIGSLNNKLESIIKERTAELELQTEALNKYGFVNSRLVRGPIESILENERQDESNLDIDYLKSIMIDLDTITVAISDVLNLENLDNIKRVEKMIKKKYAVSE